MKGLWERNWYCFGTLERGREAEQLHIVIKRRKNFTSDRLSLYVLVAFTFLVHQKWTFEPWLAHFFLSSIIIDYWLIIRIILFIYFSGSICEMPILNLKLFINNCRKQERVGLELGLVALEHAWLWSFFLFLSVSTLLHSIPWDWETAAKYFLASIFLFICRIE